MTYKKNPLISAQQVLNAMANRLKDVFCKYDRHKFFR